MRIQYATICNNYAKNMQICVKISSSFKYGLMQLCKNMQKKHAKGCNEICKTCRCQYSAYFAFVLFRICIIGTPDFARRELPRLHTDALPSLPALTEMGPLSEVDPLSEGEVGNQR